jgi:hypothetical protein
MFRKKKKIEKKKNKKKKKKAYFEPSDSELARHPADVTAFH